MKVHIGQAIKSKIEERGMPMAEFARRINTAPRNAYDILDRESIKTDLLELIGDVLDFNFFSLYSSDYDRLTVVREMEASYGMQMEVVSINVMLDGTQATVDKWINRIIAINKAIKGTI